MKKNIVKTFSYLMGKLSSDRTTRRTVNSVVKKLIRNDPKNKTEFGFSLKLKKEEGIKKALRFVNYDTYSTNFEDLYAKRIELIENIVNFHSSTKSNISKLLFQKIKELDKIKPSLYFGLEAKEGELRFKVYLHLSDINNSETVRALAKNILKSLKIIIPLIKKKIAAIGFDFDQGLKPKCKIYYLDDFRGKKYHRHKLSAFEQKIFSLLKPFCVHHHLGKRYRGNKFISNKFGVQLKKGLGKETIKKLLNLSGNGSSLKKVLSIIEATQGKIRAIDIERDNLIFYIRLKKQ